MSGLLAIVLAIAVLAPNDPPPFSPEDAVSLRFASDPQISPDGSRIVFVVQKSREKGEAWEYYHGLKAVGCETLLVVYPREPHGFREKAHLLDPLRRVREWFDARLEKPG